MKSLKIMSIVGLAVAGVSYLCFVAFDNATQYESAIGWGVLAVIYLVAFSIVVLVKSIKELKNNQ